MRPVDAAREAQVSPSREIMKVAHPGDAAETAGRSKARERAWRLDMSLMIMVIVFRFENTGAS